MKNHKLYYSNADKSFSTVSLISVYNSHVYGDYENIYNVVNEADMALMMITLEGSATVELRDKTKFTVGKNSIYFGNYLSIYAMRSNCDHWHHICYWFIPQNVSLPIGKIFVLDSIDAEEEVNEVNKVIRLLQMRVDTKLMYVNSYFCCRLIDYLERLDTSFKKNTDLVDRIILYINTHLEEDLYVKDIALHFHYSEKHLHHIFKEAINMTPKQFINNIKLENVCHMLKNTCLTIEEISDKYCYNSPSHLISNFKKRYGVTPTVYRKSNESGL